METIVTYLPMDRRQALVQGEDLPEHTIGTALFADISGFTSLTEKLVYTWGKQRSAEELTAQLNRVYDALIADVHRYRGTVISFVEKTQIGWFTAVSVSTRVLF